MGNLDKFREPRVVYPALGSSAQNIFAMLLCDISKIKASNAKAIKNAEDINKPTTKELPLEYRFSDEAIQEAIKCERQNLYTTVRGAASELLRSPVYEKTANGFKFTALFSVCKYVNSEGVLFKLTDEGRALLDEAIDGSFAEMGFELFTSFSSKYTKRLLKILHSHKMNGECRKVLSLDDYKKYLAIDRENDRGRVIKTFARSDAFRLYAIEKPFEELIAKSGGLWTPTDEKGKGYELTRVGRSYSRIKILMKYNDPNAVIDCAVEISEADIAELQEVEQVILSMGKPPTMITQPYLDKAKELGWKIPEDVKSKLGITKKND